jgi:hypothetical protein
MLALPALVVCLFTAITSFLTLNYEYLPAETDFLAWLFYDLSYIALDAALCLGIGAFCFALYEKKAFSVVLSAVAVLFIAGALPMIMFFVRSIFLASVSSAEIMEEYFTTDVYSSIANIVKMLAALVIALAVRAVFFFGKIEKPLARPIFAPKSEPTVCALALTVANLLFITLSFTFSEYYDFGSLAVQVVFAAAAYFIIILGAYMAHKKTK